MRGSRTMKQLMVQISDFFFVFGFVLAAELLCNKMWEMSHRPCCISGSNLWELLCQDTLSHAGKRLDRPQRLLQRKTAAPPCCLLYRVKTEQVVDKSEEEEERRRRWVTAGSLQREANAIICMNSSVCGVKCVSRKSDDVQDALTTTSGSVHARTGHTHTLSWLTHIPALQLVCGCRTSRDNPGDS